MDNSFTETAVCVRLSSWNRLFLIFNLISARLELKFNFIQNKIIQIYDYPNKSKILT